MLLWLLLAPAITPLIQPTLTRSADGLLHLYRVVALDQAIGQGVLFPRWFADLAYGYGLPLFVFYAPLSYYLAESLHLLGLNFVGAFNASFVLALLVSGTGMYFLVKDWFGPKAGVLAGVAYLYAPYQLFNVMERGSLPIAWAGALLPVAFWLLGRLVQQQKPIYVPLSALACAAVLLTHNISSLIFFPVLTLYLVILLLTGLYRRTISGSAIWRAGLVLALAIGLSAFFLGPAMLEREYIQVERVITPPDFDYHFNFVTFQNLFLLPRAANTGLLNPDEPMMLGLGQLVVAAVGLLGLKKLPYAPQRGLILFALAGVTGTIFLALPASVAIWDRLPLMAFVQQPHRLLSLAAFFLALLAGAAVAALKAYPRLQAGLVWLGSAVMILTAVPLLYPLYYNPLPADLSLPGMMAYERTSGAIGATSFGEYLPVWVQQTPAGSPLEPMYRSNGPIERLDRAYLPAGATVEAETYGFNRVELSIASPESYQAIFHTFYFPGWQARIDDQPAAVTPVSQRGLIGVNVPAGQRRLELYFAETPVRLAADGISALALGVTILLLATSRKRKTEGGVRPEPPLPADLSWYGAGFTRAQFIALAGLALALIGAKLLYLDRFDNPFKHEFDGATVAGADVFTRVNFGDQVNLLGYDLESPTVVPGQSLAIGLFWQARQPLGADYSVLAQLVDEEGHLYAGQDNLHPGHVPVSRWEPWGFVQDEHRVPAPPGTPPGPYLLAVGLYDPATWARLPVIEGGQPGRADTFAIPVMVLKPERPPALADLNIAWPVGKELAPGLRLLGATPEREGIAPQDFLRVALYWEAVVTPLPDYRISLRLLAEDGAVMLSRTVRPSHDRYPTPSWSAGERVRDNHALWIPADFPAGTYRLQVQVLDETGRAIHPWLQLGRLTADR